MTKTNLPKDLQQAAEQFDKFDNDVKNLTMDRLNEAPKPEVSPAELSRKELEEKGEIFLKPVRAIGSKEAFNEKFRSDRQFAEEYVCFIAKNIEIPGESIELWTKPFGGMAAQMWEVPVNKPVWGPRHLAEQLKRKYYHRLKTSEVPYNSNGSYGFYGSPVVDTTIQRLDAEPVSKSKSLFMGMR